MIKIGVISDTHIRTLEDGNRLAERLLQGPFRDVMAILHAGDHVHPELAECFAVLPYYGVCGNMDSLSGDLPTHRVLEIAGKKIGMIHGWGAPDGLERRVLDFFAGADLDVLVFGHSHRPFCELVDGVLLLNPGSPTDRRLAPFHSVGLLYLSKTVSGEIIPLD
ncbi:MAG: YfcE family phosphodiesterase [Desulfuromonas sp.]|nr:MAG: YfcE family phosphodiesterase [Desulfuromonas sp.]